MYYNDWSTTNDASVRYDAREIFGTRPEIESAMSDKRCVVGDTENSDSETFYTISERSAFVSQSVWEFISSTTVVAHVIKKSLSCFAILRIIIHTERSKNTFN